jgi:dienelactone hydrolase
LALGLFVAPAQSSAQKRPLQPSDYKSWEGLANPEISRDGRWLSYNILPVDGDGRLTIKNNDAPTTYSTPNGSLADFSDDSKWCAYLISPPKVVADRLREEKKPIETKLGIRNLESGEEQIIDSVQRFAFIKGGRYLIAHKFRGADRKEGGSDLTVLDLREADSLTLGNVTAVEVNDTGTMLAATVQSDTGKGVQVLDLASSRLRTLQWGKDDVYALNWADRADAVAFLVGKDDEKKEGDLNQIVVAAGLRDAKPRLAVFDPTKVAGFPKDKRIAEFGGAALNDDGTAVAFGIQNWADKRKPDQKPQDKPGVEIWNSKDLRVLPEQRVALTRDRQRTALCVWHLRDNAFRQISDGDVQSAMPLGNYDRAVLLDPKPYLSAVTTGWVYRDVYIVDTTTGDKTKVIEKTHWAPVASRKGNYLAYYDRRHWWLYDVKKGVRTNPTSALKTDFENPEDDLTTPEKAPAAPPVWMSNDEGVLFTDRYDAFLVRPQSGVVTKLTDGRKDRVRFRFIDPLAEEEGPSALKPMYFSAFDEREKGQGFYATDATGKGKMLIFGDKRVVGLSQARDTDRVMFVMGSFEESPNVFITNTAFSAVKPVTRTNPQQKDFAWGKAELVQFKSRWGKELQGTLIYPADYVKGRRYPMVTYIYERLSDDLHSYVRPVDYSAYNEQILSQNGYFVFKPDIAYRGNTPGQNAVDCLEPAVQAVLAKNVGVDPDKLGLMGHSWGGYQTAYVTTVSKMFKAGVAGAPLTELTSMYNTHYWNAGVTNQVLLETGQGRLAVPFWEQPKTYLENSPVWQAHKLKAPLLLAAGDNDGAVDYRQSIALYNTLRRMGKECVLLIYAGENHNFTKRPNQRDYARRLRHFFDVYLKGAKPEPWVSEGVPLLRQGE